MATDAPPKGPAAVLTLPPAPLPSLAPDREVMPSNLPPPPSLPPVDALAPPPRDTRLDEAAAMIEQNEWAKVRARLEPSRDELPATSAQLGLVLAVARREDDLTRGREPAEDDERLARESLALLLGLSVEGAAVRILARRILRRPWAAAPAPAARTSAIIVTVAIALGALVGWLLDEGFDRFYRR